MGVGAERVNPMSASNQRSQTISAVVEVIGRYSTSAEERATASCFLLLQETSESPKKIQKPVVDLQSERSPAQPTSENARISKVDDEGSNKL